MEVVMDNLLALLYFVGNTGTWFYLMIKDWPHIHGIFSFIWMAACNEGIALVWPVYWAILRWIA
jgi:hypothetical protein